MRIYRFRVLIDHESEAFRDIEIGSEQTFLDLHTAIKDAFAFIGQEMASFYVSDEEALRSERTRRGLGAPARRRL